MPPLCWFQSSLRQFWNSASIFPYYENCNVIRIPLGIITCIVLMFQEVRRRKSLTIGATKPFSGVILWASTRIFLPSNDVSMSLPSTLALIHLQIVFSTSRLMAVLLFIQKRCHQMLLLCPELLLEQSPDCWQMLLFVIRVGVECSWLS